MKKLVLFLLFSVVSFLLYADTFNSFQSGNWEIASTWVDNIIPNNAKENVVIIKSGTIVIANNLTFSKSTEIIIENGGELIIHTLNITIDAALVKKDFILSVLDGGILTINGDFRAGKNAALTIDGTTTVNGNLILGKDAIITVGTTFLSTGTLSVLGDLTAPHALLLGFGMVSVGGTIDPSIVGDSQLPVNLILFRGYSNNNINTLEWITASETNNDYFVIKCSIDNINWEEITTIRGAGNSNIENKYYFNHYTQKSFYYELSQIDYDGKYEIFNKIFVQSDIIDEDKKYSVFNLVGKFIEVAKKNEILNYKQGIYFIKYKDESRKIIIK